MTNTNKVAIGFLSDNNLDSFYQAAQEARLDDATVASEWGREAIEAAQITQNVRAISFFLRRSLENVATDANAKVAIVTDHAFLEQFGISTEDFVIALSPAFAGSLEGITITASTVEGATTLSFGQGSEMITAHLVKALQEAVGV